MRKKILLSGIAGLFMMVSPFSKIQAQAPVAEKSEVSVSEVQESLDYLSSDELEGRETGTSGLETAAQYIEQQFSKAGLQPYFETYRDRKINYSF